MHQIVDGKAQSVALGGVNATGDCPVEPQSGQMRANGGVDDVGGRVVLARDVVDGRNVDARDVRFSHTGYDVGETLRVPPDFSAGR